MIYRDEIKWEQDCMMALRVVILSRQKENSNSSLETRFEDLLDANDKAKVKRHNDYVQSIRHYKKNFEYTCNYHLAELCLLRDEMQRIISDCLCLFNIGRICIG